MGIRPNVSGGAGGERWDKRANVKNMARRARRIQDLDLGDEGLDDWDDDDLA